MVSKTFDVQCPLKWYVDVEKCYLYWCQNDTDCSMCIKVCPYNTATTEKTSMTPKEFWSHIITQKTRNDWFVYKPSIESVLIEDNSSLKISDIVVYVKDEKGNMIIKKDREKLFKTQVF